MCFTALPWDAKLPQLFPPEGTFSFILGLTRKKFPQVFPFHLHFALFASPRGIPRSPPQIPPNPPSFSEGRFFAGLSQAETAAALEVPQGTVATRQRRALQLLRLELGEEESV